MIEITNLCKSFGELEVLKNISLTVNDGEIYGLVGRSGAGKSTLLRCINGLETYDSGSLKINGEEVGAKSKEEIRELRRDIGMIFQHFSLINRRSVYKNVALPMKCWKMSKKDIDVRVRELLELVQISDKINERPATLSGGQKQRVAIARALTMQPKILLCDEATSALDPKTTHSVLELLRDINRKLNLTIIVVTHQMEVVRDVCDTISILEDGKISDAGGVREVFLRKPESLMNLLGTESRSYADGGKIISFFLNEQQMPIVPHLFAQYPDELAILSASTADYKAVPYTEFTIRIPEERMEAVRQVLTAENISWYLPGQELN